MNLYAYSQEENLKPILKEINLEIPRLRGLCLMKFEKPSNYNIAEELLYNPFLEDWEMTALECTLKKQGNKQQELWNKYCGKDVLFIHARQGGGNREYYMPDVQKHPRYLDDVDDSYDCTYCDIYVDISGIDITKYITEE